MPVLACVPDQVSIHSRSGSRDERACERRDNKSLETHEEEEEGGEVTPEPPPELPPRQNRRNSSNENSPLLTPVPHRTHFAFDLPEGPEQPPPLPPRSLPRRASRGTYNWESNTLPRSMFRPAPSHPSAAAVFPEHLRPPPELPRPLQHSHAAVNGEGSASDLPELPPRTYRRNIVHSRQQSS